MAMRRAGKRCFASNKQSSGPIPAGSPEVIAMIGRALEIRHGVAGIDPVELAAARRTAAVVRVHARQLGEIGAAVDDALAQIEQAAARLAFGDDLAGAHENMARARLRDGSAAAADLAP